MLDELRPNFKLVLKEFLAKLIAGQESVTVDKFGEDAWCCSCQLDPEQFIELVEKTVASCLLDSLLTGSSATKSFRNHRLVLLEFIREYNISLTYPLEQGRLAKYFKRELEICRNLSSGRLEHIVAKLTGPDKQQVVIHQINESASQQNLNVKDISAIWEYSNVELILAIDCGALEAAFAKNWMFSQRDLDSDSLAIDDDLAEKVKAQFLRQLNASMQSPEFIAPIITELQDDVREASSNASALPMEVYEGSEEGSEDIQEGPAKRPRILLKLKIPSLPPRQYPPRVVQINALTTLQETLNLLPECKVFKSVVKLKSLPQHANFLKNYNGLVYFSLDPHDFINNIREAIIDVSPEVLAEIGYDVMHSIQQFLVRYKIMFDSGVPRLLLSSFDHIKSRYTNNVNYSSLKVFTAQLLTLLEEHFNHQLELVRSQKVPACFPENTGATILDSQLLFLEDAGAMPEEPERISYKLCLLEAGDNTADFYLGLAKLSNKQGLISISPFAAATGKSSRLKHNAPVAISKYIDLSAQDYQAIKLSNQERYELLDALHNSPQDDLLVLRYSRKSNRVKNKTANDYFSYKTKTNIRAFRSAYKISLDKANRDSNPQNLITEPAPIPEDELVIENTPATEKLYLYQKQALKTLLARHRSGKGSLLADDMGLGKTIQAGAFVATNNQFPVLVICPLSVVTKWKEELVEMCGFALEDIAVFHGEGREYVKGGAKVVVTSYNTFGSEWRQSRASEFKRSFAYCRADSFANINTKAREDLQFVWDKLPELVHDISSLPWLNKNWTVKFIPNDQQLGEIIAKAKDNLNLDIQPTELAGFLLSQLIYKQLIKSDVISPQGLVFNWRDIGLSEYLLSILMIENFFQDYSYYLKENTFELLITAANVKLICNIIHGQRDWRGVVLDEGHAINNPGSKTSKSILPLGRAMAESGGLRLVLSGTPLENKLQDLWVLHEFLNPGLLLKRKAFQEIFEFLLEKAVSNVRTFSVREHVQRYQMQSLRELPAKFTETLTHLQYVSRVLRASQVRRLKTDEIVRTAIPSQNTYLPAKQLVPLQWSLSNEQRHYYERMDKSALESACRGFAFFSVEEKSQQKKTNGLIGTQLLNNLGQMLDHPVLRSKDYHDKFFDSNRNFDSKVALVEDVTSRRYNNDLDKFINASGKLAVFMRRVSEILDANDDNRILITTTSIASAAIIKYVISQKCRNTQAPLFYYGAKNKEQRRNIQEVFNGNNNYRVVILSQSAGALGIELYASHVIPYHGGYNPYPLLQAIDRAVRYGSPYKEVEVIELRCDNPYTEKLRNIAADKIAWGHLMVDGSPSCDVNWLLDRLKHYMLIYTGLGTHTAESLEAKIDEMKRVIVDPEEYIRSHDPLARPAPVDPVFSAATTDSQFRKRPREESPSRGSYADLLAEFGVRTVAIGSSSSEMRAMPRDIFSPTFDATMSNESMFSDANGTSQGLWGYHNNTFAAQEESRPDPSDEWLGGYQNLMRRIAPPAP